MPFSNYKIGAFLIIFSLGSDAVFPCPSEHVSQWRNPSDFIVKVAVPEKDTREPRTPENTAHLSDAFSESNQGRLWCRISGLKVPDIPPDRSDLLTSYNKSNASIVFENDVILLSRHAVIDRSGKQVLNPSSCYFEHIASGKLIPLTDKVAYPDYTPIPGHPGLFFERDIALVRIKEKIADVQPVKMSDIMIRPPRAVGDKLTIVANAANNNKDHNPLDLTIAECNVGGVYTREGDGISNQVPTTCADGKASSGALVYAENERNEPKVFGIASSHMTLNPPGSGHDPLRLTTIIDTFDESLPETYEKLKAMDGPSSNPHASLPPPPPPKPDDGQDI